MEARMQAELLYALRAITRYMTWSAVLVYLLNFFLLLLMLLQWDTSINVKTTKKKEKVNWGRRRTLEQRWKTMRRLFSTEPTCWITCVITAQPAVPKLATGGRLSRLNPSSVLDDKLRLRASGGQTSFSISNASAIRCHIIISYFCEMRLKKKQKKNTRIATPAPVRIDCTNMPIF